jgi:Tat protein translocase TatC
LKDVHLEETIDEVEKTRMSLGAHLEELRRVVIRSIIAIIICFFVCWFFKVQILTIAEKPHRGVMEKCGLSTELQVLSYQEGFYTYMKLCFITAVFFAYPVVIYQVWRFVSVGLYKKEKRYLILFLPVSYAAFVMGGIFGYFLLIPFGLQFLISILGPGVQPIITMQQYVSFVFMLTVALGLVFQLPLLMFLLSKIGIITPDKFIKWRRYAILAIFIIAAVVTPPDPFTQLMTAAPMLLLYELGILISKPDRKGFFVLGAITGGGMICIASVYFYFTHRSGEIGRLHAYGNIQFMYPESKGWSDASGQTHFRKGIVLQAGDKGKTAILTKRGVTVRIDENTRIHFADPWKIKLLEGQVLVSLKEPSEIPFEIDTPNGKIRTNKGTVNIQAKDLLTIVTAVKGEATLLVEGEEKKLLEGRQHKLSIGGEPVDIGSIINWSEGVLDKSDGM